MRFDPSPLVLPWRKPSKSAGMNDKTKPQEKRGGWLSRFAPGVRKIVSRRDTPDNLWVKDPDSGEMLYRSDLEAALWVTPSGRHMRIDAHMPARRRHPKGGLQVRAIQHLAAVGILDPEIVRGVAPRHDLAHAGRKAAQPAAALFLRLGLVVHPGALRRFPPRKH